MSKLSTIDEAILNSAKPEKTRVINLKCKDYKLLEYFFDPSSLDTDRDVIIDEIIRRDPLLLNELLSNIISVFIEQQTHHLKTIIYYLIDSNRVDLPKKIQLIDTLITVCADKTSSMKHVIVILASVSSFDLEKQKSESVSTTLLLDLIKKLLNEDNSKWIDNNDKSQFFEIVRSIFRNSNFNDDFKYKIFDVVKKDDKIALSDKIEIAFITSTFSFCDYKYNLFTCQYVHRALLNNYTDSQDYVEKYFDSIEYLYSLALQTSDEKHIADIADFLSNHDNFKKRTNELFEKIQWNAASLYKHVYNNSQNIHCIDVDKSVKPFIDHLLSVPIDSNIPPVNDEEAVKNTINMIIDRCASIIEVYKLKNCSSKKIERTIQRFILDNSVYTDKSVSLLQIFFRTYFYIVVFKNESAELLKRFVEELDEMSETCSTGHLVRLVNVFSGFENSLTIDVEQELKSCIFQRLTNIINSKSNEDTEQIYEDVQSEAFMRILSADLVSLFKELEIEYVSTNIISLDHLQNSFRTYITLFQTGS